jgi:muconolactone delta-isomerase
MEFLVTMTTQVPSGVPEEDVAEVRRREAAHTRELAAEGRVLRLWRSPLQPGEWRTIGLFAADGPEQLEHTLASMPLRVWRTDEVTALGVHPNDPGPGSTAPAQDDTEFLTTFVLAVPAGTAPDAVAAAAAREAERARELASEGVLIRLWSLPEANHNLGLWQVADEGRMQAVLRSLPLADWLRVTTMPLTLHPSDPATSPPEDEGSRS